MGNTLFGIGEPADYRYSFNGQLSMEARMLCLDLETQIYSMAKALHPNSQIQVHTSFADVPTAPMYVGKRYAAQL